MSDIKIISQPAESSWLAEAKNAWAEITAKPAHYVPYLGWMNIDVSTAGMLEQMKEIAEEVRQNTDAFVVIGIGGSNQSARAVVEALGARDIEMVWAGNTLSSFEMDRLLKSLEGKRFYIQVIAKNFETIEPGSTWRLLRHVMTERFGAEDTARRTILTGTPGSRMHEIAQEKGMRFLPFPEPVGGRFSAFCPVGVLPLAVAGLDVDAYFFGVREAQAEILKDGGFALPYAAWRNECHSRGYLIEMMCAFEPRLDRFGKWWRQLFAESEGKDGKGIFPSYAIYSEDLHAIGQYVQDGSPILMENFITVVDPGAEVFIPADKDSRDGFDYLDGKSFTQINHLAESASIAAHEQVLPVFHISVQHLDEKTFGALYYQFMVACVTSARLLGVNPFDQEGVEEYKRRMFIALGR